jgi:hypothetical protein
VPIFIFLSHFSYFHLKLPVQLGKIRGVLTVFPGFTIFTVQPEGREAMKRLRVLALAVAALMLAAGSVRACHHGCGWCCPPPCDTCSNVCVSWVDQVVTCYHTEMRERSVPVVVQRPVYNEVVTPYTCTVMVPEYHNERRVATVYTSVPHQVTQNVTYCRAVPVYSTVTQWVTSYTQVPRQVTYNVNYCRTVPVYGTARQWVTRYTRVPRPVTYNVTTCHLVPVTCTDPCTGCCHTVCQPQYSTQPVTTTVWECVPHQEEVTVPTCTYHTEWYTQPVTTTVWECVPVRREVTATVCNYKTEYYTQPVTSTVYECVPVQREYWVSVCSYRPVQQTYQYRHVVCSYTSETVWHREWYCVNVPYQTTVKVPVYTPVCAQPSAGWGGCCQ